MLRAYNATYDDDDDDDVYIYVYVLHSAVTLPYILNRDDGHYQV